MMMLMNLQYLCVIAIVMMQFGEDAVGLTDEEQRIIFGEFTHFNKIELRRGGTDGR